MRSTEPAAEESKGLRRNLSVWAALGLSLALLGPSMAANINPQGPAGLVGSSVPLVFALSAVGVLLVAHSFVRLSQHVASAGSVYGFIGASIGPRSGFVAGWLLLGTYVAFAVTTIAGASLFLDEFFATAFDLDLAWELFAAVVVVLVAVLASRPAKAATNVLLAVEVITIVLILAVAIVVLVKVAGGAGPDGGSEVSALFSLSDGVSTSALFAAMVFGFLSFAGFEAAATLGEETRNPRRTIPIALLGTVVLAGVFFVVVTTAEVLGFGTNADGVAALTGSGSLVGDLARMYLSGAVGDLVTLGAAVSAFGSALACAVGASRLLFAMGRDGFISTRLGEARESDGVPRNAVAAVLVVAAAILVVLRLVATDQAVDVFFWAATLGSLALLVAYFMSLLGAGRFLFLTLPRRAPLIEAAIPLAGLALIGYVLYRNVWPIPDAPYNTFPYVVAAWAAIGLAVVICTPGLARRMGARLTVED